MFDCKRYLKLPKEPADRKYDRIKVATHEYKKKMLHAIKNAQ